MKIQDIMTGNVVTAKRHHTVAQVKASLRRRKIGSLPVVDDDNHAIGIVSSLDLLDDVSKDSPVSQIMTKPVYTIPQYSDVHIAARMMRNHKIHHLIVTHEKEVVGIISSFDLLKLVEKHRFVEKTITAPRRPSGKRAKTER